MGSLYALSTLGSITGTFLAGFYLIPGYRLTLILVILGTVLILTSVFLVLYNGKRAIPQVNNDIINEDN